ncbi:MAG: hypothetical protein E7Z91_07225 [Cyanobacteria bacterium SIG30]|nr:hypothetical protein [Cyanobacteria bacterium SIG30]
MTANIDFYKIFNNIQCPFCGTEFDKDDFHLIRNLNDKICVLQLRCKKCTKSFAVGFFGLDEMEILKLKSNSSTKPISYDEILDIHHKMKNFDKNWYEFIKNYKN